MRMQGESARLGDHAVVIGGSMTGMMVARVLADHFARVTVLERDEIPPGPEPRRYTPQGNHYHALLVGGQRVLEELYPGFTQRLEQSGAVPVAAGLETASHGPEGVGGPPPPTEEPRDVGLRFYNQSRALLEHCLRQFHRAHDGITERCPASARRLLSEDGRVHGVEIESDGEIEPLEADLVVDAGGRAAHTPRWLESMGCTAPEETAIGVDFAYSSAVFRLPAELEIREKLATFGGPPPDHPNGAITAPIEGGLWIVSLAGRFGDYPPGDEEGFLAFARALPTPVLYERLKDAEQVGPIHRFRFPSSVHRRYERLRDFPRGLLVIGDAICSVNPAYGQGISAGALQVRALAALLRERAASGRGIDDLAPEFFARSAEVIVTPWTLAANVDLAYPKTVGERPAGMQEGARYFAELGALASEDAEVGLLIAEVFQLVHPLSVLMQEPLLGRVTRRLEAKASSA
jgi:2-polyprenyl-6-methoxyphenol hydroxylase-like FAD-dependent oxidoreductase